MSKRLIILFYLKKNFFHFFMTHQTIKNFIVLKKLKKQLSNKKKLRFFSKFI